MRMLVQFVAVGLAFVSFGAGGAFAQTAPDPAALEFTQVTPCRAFDTRATTPVAANTTRSFHISGSSSFPEQGGPAHGCGVPAYASAVSITLTALNEAADGYLTAFAYRAPQPSNVSLYYHANFTLTNTVTAPISQGNLSIYSSRQTHVAGDVTGYYAPQMHASVRYDGTLVTGSRATSARKDRTGTYAVVFDRNLWGCSAVASADYAGRIANVFLGYYNDYATVYVYIYNTESALSDYDFHLSVRC